MTERIASLDKSKSQFLSLASHELRSPLAVMGGYLSMLEQGSLGPLGEGQRAVAVLKARTPPQPMPAAEPALPRLRVISEDEEGLDTRLG